MISRRICGKGFLPAETLRATYYIVLVSKIAFVTVVHFLGQEISSTKLIYKLKHLFLIKQKSKSLTKKCKLSKKNANHAYITGHYNPSVRITTSLPTPVMLCSLVFYICGGVYSLRSTSNDWIFDKIFMAGMFTLENFCYKSAERKLPKKYFFHISFWCMIWHTNPGFTCNKPTRYLLDYDDFYK